MKELTEQQLKAIVSEALEEKLGPIRKDIENIKTALGNHVVHLTEKLNDLGQNYTSVSTDMAWIKKLYDPENIATQAADAKTNISWLKWLVRLGVTTAIGMLVDAVVLLWHIIASK